MNTMVVDATRKSVQMHMCARYIAQMLAKDGKNKDYGRHLTYEKAYLGILGDEVVFIEPFLPGEFEKYVNNDGNVLDNECEIGLKAQAFVHFSYVVFDKQALVLDVQGCNFSMTDAEIATSTITSVGNTGLFCGGNFREEGIARFFEQHTCNDYCRLLELEE